MIRCSLPTANIGKISLCEVGLKVHFHYLGYHIRLEYFNAQRSILYMEKLVIGQVIILSKDEITWNRYFMTTTSNININPAISKTSNAEL